MKYLKRGSVTIGKLVSVEMLAFTLLLEDGTTESYSLDLKLAVALSLVLVDKHEGNIKITMTTTGPTVDRL